MHSATTIHIAATINRGRDDSVLCATASTDLDDGEAAAVLRRAAAAGSMEDAMYFGWSETPARSVDLFLTVLQETANRSFVDVRSASHTAADGREFPPERQGASYARHCARWGNRHREISPILGGDWGDVRALDCHSESAASFPLCHADEEDHWAAWRSRPPVRAGARNSAMDVAALLARAAYLFAKSERDDEEATLGREIRRRFIGDGLFKAATYYAVEERYHWDYINLRDNWRPADWEDDHPNDMARLAHSMRGEDLECRRDRLLCKMLSRGVPPDQTLALRPRRLHVDGVGHCFLAWQGRRFLLCVLDTSDLIDLWALVRVVPDFDDPLFARVESDGSYGHMRMERGDLTAMLVRRRETSTAS